MIRALALTAIFLAALFGSGTLLCEVQPFAAVPQVREKAAHFAAHADDYDTLFCGTSKVYHGLMPAVFDELTARAGVPTRSFNLGLDALLPPEDSYVLERVLAYPPKHLRWVFLETNVVRTGFRGFDAESARNIHWHDAGRTLLMWRALFAPPQNKVREFESQFGSEEERDALTQAVIHARLWALRSFNAGRGGLLFASWMQRARHMDLAPILGPADDGFIAMSADGRARSSSPGEYARHYAERAAKTGHRATLDDDAQRNLDTMLARIRAAGAQPILLIAPTLQESRSYPQPGCAAPMLDFGELEKWPELFRAEHRLDHLHLNAAGAELYTRAVAAQFLEIARPLR